MAASIQVRRLESAPRTSPRSAAWLAGALMAGAMGIAVVPFVWAFLTALQTERQIYAFPPRLLPDPVTLANYALEFQQGLGRGLMNSALAAFSAVVLTVVTASMCAYPLARLRFRGSGVLLLLIVAPMMVPGLVNLIPTFMILASLGLLDTYTGLILVYWVHALPVSIWILRAFYQTLPLELEEAATVDGASRLQVLVQIITPIAQPALVAVAVIDFLAAWNDYVIAAIMTSSAEMRTAQVFLYANIGDVYTNWGGLMASAIVVTLPVLLVFAFLQRQFIDGLIAGALKG